MNFSEVNELNVLKKEKFLFIKFCKLLDFPGFLPKNVPGFFSFQPEIKRGGARSKKRRFHVPLPVKMKYLTFTVLKKIRKKRSVKTSVK